MNKFWEWIMDAFGSGISDQPPKKKSKYTKWAKVYKCDYCNERFERDFSWLLRYWDEDDDKCDPVDLLNSRMPFMKNDKAWHQCHTGDFHYGTFENGILK